MLMHQLLEEEELQGILSKVHWYGAEELLQTFLLEDLEDQVDEELPDHMAIYTSHKSLNG